MTYSFFETLLKPCIGTRESRFTKACSTPRPFSLASQIVYPACTVPSTRWILYYRVEYLMRPATLGTRGKKFEVPPLPGDISHPSPLILFASIFAIGEGRIFYENTPRYAIQYSCCLSPRVTSFGIRS